MIIDAEFEEIEESGGSGGADDADGELDLSSDESLPWLEADEEDEGAGGVDTAQIVGFGVVLIALALGIIGAIYLITNRTADPELVADGSTIAAPEGPIKERPDDPGGKEFAGTGNVAPAVGEGQTREGQIGGSEGESGSKLAAADGGEADAPATSEPKPTPVASGGAYVQLAAYGTRARAEQGWRDLSRQTSALSGRSHRVVEAQVGGATVYRLQVIQPDRAAASELCSAIKADGLDCAVK